MKPKKSSVPEVRPYSAEEIEEMREAFDGDCIIGGHDVEQSVPRWLATVAAWKSYLTRAEKAEAKAERLTRERDKARKARTATAERARTWAERARTWAERCRVAEAEVERLRLLLSNASGTRRG